MAEDNLFNQKGTQQISVDKRNHVADIASGFFVLEIVIQHLLQNTNLGSDTFWTNYIEHFFLAFMPWFFFKSGYMAKETSGPVWVKIKKRGMKLLYPYLVWSLIPAILILPLFLINHEIGHWINNIGFGLVYAQGTFNTPLWFLSSLFIVYCLFYLGCIKGSVIHLVILGGASFWVSMIPILLPLGLNTVPLGCFFFSYGMFLQRKSLRIGIILWVMILIVYTTLIFVHYSAVNFHKNILTNGNYFLYLIEMALFLLLVQQLFSKNTYCTPLEFVGRKSIIFYVTHAPVIVILVKLNETTGNSMSSQTLLLLMIASIIVLWTVLVWQEKYTQILFSYPLKK